MLCELNFYNLSQSSTKILLWNNVQINNAFLIRIIFTFQYFHLEAKETDILKNVLSFSGEKYSSGRGTNYQDLGKYQSGNCSAMCHTSSLLAAWGPPASCLRSLICGDPFGFSFMQYITTEYVQRHQEQQ